ncbi:hypothetical protein ACFLUJ_05255 [Chloroflexota bacterium]
MSPTGAFRKDSDKNRCYIQEYSTNVEHKDIVSSKGMGFTEGTPLMGIDVAMRSDVII